jgi:hypothetical protein
MMMTGMHTRASTSFLRADGHVSGATEDREKQEHAKVLGDPYEWKSAATVALVFFVASLAAAPALTRDQHKLASEINAMTLKAAAAIKNSRVKH